MMIVQGWFQGRFVFETSHSFDRRARRKVAHHRWALHGLMRRRRVQARPVPEMAIQVNRLGRPPEPDDLAMVSTPRYISYEWDCVRW